MLADLAALTPPLIVAVAFLIGLVMFLRRQMAPRQDPVDDCDDADIATGAGNADAVDPAHGSPAGPDKV